MFPVDLITLERPVGSQNRTGHADLHVLTAELVEALMAKVGIDNSNDTSSIDYILREDVVHRTGNEPIYGVKTFSSSPIVPTPTTGTQASNKDYSDTLNPDFYQYSIIRSVGNLIANNSFEVDLSGYTTYGLLTISRVTSEFYSGVASMQIVASNNVSGVYVGYSFVAGKRYTLSFYAKGTSGKQVLSYTDAGGTLTSTLNGGWQRFEYTFIANISGLAGINFRSAEAGGDTFYVDAVQLEEGTTTAGPFTTTQGNLTVALKNYEGNDPTPTKPVKIMIGGVVRTITSALSYVLTAGGNYYNAGSSELATKEIDYFVNLMVNTSSGNLYIGASRIIGTRKEDFVAYPTTTSEKFLPFVDGIGAGDPVVNIGRFNATLSAGPGYTWSIPYTSVIINRPIYETRELSYQSTATCDGGATMNGLSYYSTYIIKGNTIIKKIRVNWTSITGGTAYAIFLKKPFQDNYSDWQFKTIGDIYDSGGHSIGQLFNNVSGNEAIGKYNGTALLGTSGSLIVNTIETI